jgi:hypothetical protein
MHMGFLYETLNGRNHLEGLGTDGSINIQTDLEETGSDSMVWTYLVQDVGNLISSVLLASQRGLFSKVSK